MVSCANTPRPSGTRARPRRDQLERRRAGDVLAVVADRARARPAAGPQMPFSVVVLPAPLAPIRQTSSPWLDVEVDALDRADAAVGDLEASSSSSGVPDAAHALQVQRDLAAEVGLDHLRDRFCTSAGSPSAIFLP